MKRLKNSDKLKGFLEKVSELNIEEIELPEFYIPNWPKEAEVRVSLGRREFLLPVKTKETELYKLKKKKKGISFRISSDGSIEMDIRGDYREYTSNSYITSRRICVLILFYQFEEEIYERVIEELKTDRGEHHQVVELVKKAFDPFKPFLVADKLSDS